MPDWFSDNAPKASKASGPDWFELYRPDRKPVSAEDFAPPQRDVSYGAMALNALKAIPSAVVDTVKTAYTEQRPEDAALGPARVLAPVIRNAIASQRAAAGKAVDAARAGRYSEAAGQGAAALLPLVGPAAAQAGEDIGSGEPERIERGGGNAAALIASSLAPRVVPKVAPPLASIGEQLAAKGRAVATNPLLREAVKTAVVEGAGHSLGVPPLVGSAMRVMLRNVLEKGKTAASEKPLPALVEHGPEIEASLRGTVSPPLAAHGPDIAPNAGGTLVKEAAAPGIAQQLADSLAEIQRQKAQPSRITTPPQPDLPPGYAPRTTVPKPKAAKPAPTEKSAQAPKPARSTTIGQKNYFLRKMETAAPKTEAAAPRELNVEDLPVSWRSRTTQPIGKTIAPADMAQAMADELSSQGVSAEDAMMAVTKNKALKPSDRLALLNALNQARRLKVAQ